MAGRFSGARKERGVPRLGILAADEYLRSPQNRGLLGKGYEVRDFSDWAAWASKELLARCRSVDVLITGRRSPMLPLDLASDFGRLRYVCHLHGTIRHLVPKRLIEAGLVVTNWGDNVWHVAEGAMALVLSQLKQLTALSHHTKGGPNCCIRQAYRPSLKGRDVGLYGFGPVGRHMADLLRPFGAKVAIYDPYAKRVPRWVRRCETLRDLFATCQIISIHCGLNDQTRGSVTRDLLALLPQGGLLVNTARGAIVDEKALADLVGARRLIAGIDVIQDESDWPASPLAPHGGAVLTHHHVSGAAGSGATHEWRQSLEYHTWRKVPRHALANLDAFRRGKPLKYVVTADVYDLKT
jgi:phosphoglycerate dehydrogenase-like enzyme